MPDPYGKPPRGLGNSYKPADTEVLISAVAHHTPPPFQVAQNATTVNTRSSVAPLPRGIHQHHLSATPANHPMPYTSDQSYALALQPAIKQAAMI